MTTEDEDFSLLGYSKSYTQQVKYIIMNVRNTNISKEELAKYKAFTASLGKYGVEFTKVKEGNGPRVSEILSTATRVEKFRSVDNTRAIEYGLLSKQVRKCEELLFPNDVDRTETVLAAYRDANPRSYGDYFAMFVFLVALGFGVFLLSTINPAHRANSY